MQVVSQVLDFTSRFEACGIPYMITGSVAGIVYGEPRMTNDVDVILEITSDHIPLITDAFPLDQYYCPPAEVIRVELERDLRGHFNLVRHDTGFKADIYLSGSDPLHRWAMQSRRCMQIGSESVWLAPPEYVIIRKMEFFREGDSHKHLTDIVAMLANLKDSLDITQIESMALERGLSSIWIECTEKL